MNYLEGKIVHLGEYQGKDFEWTFVDRAIVCAVLPAASPAAELKLLVARLSSGELFIVCLEEARLEVPA